MLTRYRVKDFLDWYDAGTLKLTPDFQRRPNWPVRAQCYFIDTLLRRYPTPLLYLRPSIDPETKQPFREVVDGQQRLTAIVEFRQGKLRLDKQTNEYNELTFDELERGDQEDFLSYEMGVEELYNASDEFVLDVFHRLNAYGVRLNPQELRHGRFLGKKYKGVFRLEVIKASQRWSVLWERHKVVSVRDRVRMADDELMAQMFGVILKGVSDGGQRNINSLYTDFDSDVPQEAVERLDKAVEFILKNLPNVFATRLRGAPHFLMLFAVVAHALFGLPNGDMGKRGNPRLPARDPLALTNLTLAHENLAVLAKVLDSKEPEILERFFEFKVASAGTTQRIRSRSRRFVALYQALLPNQI